MVIDKGLFLSLFGEEAASWFTIYFVKLHVRQEGFSFYGPSKSDEEADTDLIYNFCWLKRYYVRQYSTYRSMSYALNATCYSASAYWLGV